MSASSVKIRNKNSESFKLIVRITSSCVKSRSDFLVLVKCQVSWQQFLYAFYLLIFCLCLVTLSLILLAFGQCFSKVLFVYKEFCDYDSGTLNF